MLTSVAWFVASMIGQVPKGTPLISPDAYLKTTIQGLPLTNAEATTNSGILSVDVRKAVSETNATQLTIMTEGPVTKGDIIFAQFDIRGGGKSGPAKIDLLFERSSAPWGKSFSEVFVAPTQLNSWRKVSTVFKCTDTYKTGEAMLSFRMATQIQKVELRDVRLSNLGPETSRLKFEDLSEKVSEEQSFGFTSTSLSKPCLA
jgi:hypothetical protein